MVGDGPGALPHAASNHERPGSIEGGLGGRVSALLGMECHGLMPLSEMLRPVAENTAFVTSVMEFGAVRKDAAAHP